MNVGFKIIAAIFSLSAVCWALVQFDKQKKIGVSSSSMMRYRSSGTRKLLSDNFSIASSSEDSSSFESHEQEPDKKQCVELHELVSRKDQCIFIKTHSSCHMSQGFVQYLHFPYCNVPNAIAIAFIVLGIWLIYLINITGMIADEYFSPSLVYIYKTLGISEHLAGVTFLAFGNGVADILSTISVFTGNCKGSSAGLAFNSIMGAGIFITTILLGVISFTGPFTLNSRPFTRDVLFYLGAVVWAFLTFYKGSITLYEALGYIGLYVVYVALVVTGQYIYKRWKSMLRSLGNTLPTVRQEGSLHQSTEWCEDSDESEIEVIVNSFSSNQKNKTSPENKNAVKASSRINCAEAPSIAENTLIQVNGSSIQHRILPLADESTPLLGSSKSRSFTLLSKIWKGIKPWNNLKWREARCVGKFCIVINAPAIFCLNLTIPTVDFGEDDRLWNKWLNAFHCLVDPVFIVFVVGYGQAMVGNALPLWAVMLVAGSILALIVALSTKENTLPRFHCAFAFMSFVVSLFWIYTAVKEIINLLKTIGIAFKLSDGILGLTFLAWGNSLPDFVTNWALARHGFHKMVVAACFGAPFQDLLLGFGISFIIATVRGGHSLELRHDSNQYIISASFLAVSLASSAVVVPLMGFKIPRPYGVYLILLYISYLAVSLSEEIKHF